MTRPRSSPRGTPVAAKPGVWLLAATFAAVTAGCASTTSIDRLRADPSARDGEEVRIEGEVRESLGLPGTGVYRVDDGTGRLPVVSREGGSPRSGTRVVVEGTFRAAFTLGDQSLAVLLEERREVKD